MQLNVLHILQQPEGARESFTMSDERPTFSDITLLQPINGELTAVRVEGGIDMRAQVSTKVELECHRCLNSFEHNLDVVAKAQFRDTPDDDQWPIADDHTIDLGEPVRQELILNLPVKQLCSADCAGIQLNA